MLSLSPSGTQNLVTGLPLCFSGSGIQIIPEESIRSLDIPASGSGWTYDTSSQIFKKTSGTNGVYTSVISNTLVYGKQPFYIKGDNTAFITPGGSNYNSHCFIGVYDDEDNWYAMEIMKYCNSNSCGAVGGSNWVLSVNAFGSIVYSRSVNYNEIFYVRSDGVSLYFEHIQGGQKVVDHVIPVLPETGHWRFAVGAAYVGNEISAVSTYKGSYQGAVPITWSTPGGGTLAGSGDVNRCFSAATPGTYTVCIDSDYDDPLCTTIAVASLYFNPVDIDCGACIFVNQTVEFESNGGLAGTLEVVDEDENPVGIVIDPLHWQAPNEPVVATVKYTLDAVTIECTLNVIDEFEVLNVDGDTVLGLVPGDKFQLITNYDDGEIIWENINCEHLVSTDGLITIPKNYKDKCFGSVDCTIRAHVMSIPGGDCDNLVYGGANAITKDLRIYVEPTFPTPELGGPDWLKWKPEVPDFRVISKTMEGGCSETYLRNRVPVQRWTVSYDFMRYPHSNECIEPCCDDPNDVFFQGIDPADRHAKVLDDFWMFVTGEAGYFTLIDPRDGYVWRRVRFEQKMQRDHVNWLKSQSRSLNLIWNPCCANEPEGGICIHFTTREDILPPTVPTNLVLTSIPYTGGIDYGVTTFVVDTPGDYFRVNGSSPNPGLGLYRGVNYTFEINTASNHPFEIEDNLGNPWTDGVINNNISEGTLRFHVPLDAPGSLYYKCPIHAFGGELPMDDPPPPPPPPLGRDTDILSWDKSFDDVGVKEYEIEQYSVGNTTRWKVPSTVRETHVQLYSFDDSARVRAIDYTGNVSDWSDVVNG